MLISGYLQGLAAIELQKMDAAQPFRFCVGRRPPACRGEMQKPPARNPVVPAPQRLFASASKSFFGFPAGQTDCGRNYLPCSRPARSVSTPNIRGQVGKNCKTFSGLKLFLGESTV
jgi:hypothetical protein